MRKAKLLLVLFCFTSFLFNQSLANSVSLATAQTIAKNFYKVTVPAAYNVTLNPVLAYSQLDSNGTSYDFYAFNMAPLTGFVIVSGCDATTPILAYSAESNFTSVIPAYAAINDWIKSASKRVHYAVANNLQATATVQGLWTSYAAGQNPNVLRSTTVGPLLVTTWNQNPYYNALCPPAATASTSSNKSVTGCVATTMSQIMKYWNYPAAGTGGTYSYTDNQSNGYQENYGTLSTNLSRGLTWSGMPNNVTSNTSAVDSLMYECGVSVDMDYSPNGSGAFVRQAEAGTGNPCAQYSYLNYFYYNSSTMAGVTLAGHTDAAWVTLMETEINAGRPVEYEGQDPTQGGHTWVMDGYQTSTTAAGGALLHMNWGWGGYDDGYFDVTNLLTTNGGFNPSQDDAALTGILPLVTASSSVTPLCQGDSTKLSVTTGYPTGVTYAWSPTTGLACPTCVSTSAAPTATTTYTVTASIAGYGNIGTASVTVNVSPLPAAPTSVTLPTAPCTGATATYTVPTVTGATSYTWSVSGTGWSGTSTTHTITLTAGSGNATVSVTANNACGSSAPYVFTAPHSSGPAAPTSVTMPTAPCTGATATYTVPTVSGATSYTWSISGTGWSGSSTTNSITLTAGSGNATVSVTANNSCGSSTAYVFTAIHASGPSAPTSVTLPTAPCTGASATYTVPTVSGATSYTWSVSGTGWTGSSTTNTITYTAGSGEATVSVTANNSCGSSTAYVFIAPHGAGPAAPTSVTLPTVPCPNSTAVYTVPAVTGATSYTWSISGTGWSGTSTTNSITLTAGTATASVSVTANNACGSSTVYSFSAPVSSIPAAPSSVTLPTAPCTSSTAVYTIPTVTGATSYTWTVSGSGWSGTSTTNSITLTAGSGSGTVTVKANNSCGSSSVYTFTAPHGAVPNAPTSVTLPTAPCTGATAVYTVPTVSGATSYTWSISGAGWSGTSTTNSITLTAGSGPANVSVTANSACGSSTAYTFTAAHAAGPAAPTSITLPSPPCVNATGLYITSPVSGATSYVWSVSGTGWSGSSSTDSITLTAGTGAASVSVSAVNNCGTSTPYVFTPTSNTVPDPAVSISAPSVVCSDGTATFSTPTIIGVSSYDWVYSGTGWTGSSTTNSITLTGGTGPIAITVSGVNGCGAGQPYSLANVNVVATPVASFTENLQSVGTGSNVSITFTGSAPAGTTYAWTFDGGTASPGTGVGPQVVDWTTGGTKTVTLTLDNGGCLSSVYSDSVVVSTKSTGISTIQAAIEAINVVPNPASTQANILIDVNADAIISIDIYDMTGRLVSNVYNGGIATGEKSIGFTTENISAGIYVVKVSDGQSFLQKRFIKL